MVRTSAWPALYSALWYSMPGLDIENLPSCLVCSLVFRGQYPTFMEKSSTVELCRGYNFTIVLLAFVHYKGVRAAYGWSIYSLGSLLCRTKPLPAGSFGGGGISGFNPAEMQARR